MQELDDWKAYSYLAGLIFFQLIFLVMMIEWLYPPNETPSNATIYKMTTNVQSLVRTGAPVLPATALSLGELRKLSLEKAFQKRGFELNEEDSRAVGAVKDIDTNHLKDRKKLYVDTNLIYGPLFTRRTHYNLNQEQKEADPENTTNSLKVQVNTINTAEEEDMIRKPLRRQKKADKKKKNKKTIQALNMLTLNPIKESSSSMKPVGTSSVITGTPEPVATTPISKLPRDKLSKAKSVETVEVETQNKTNKKRRLKRDRSCEAIEEIAKSEPKVKEKTPISSGMKVLNMSNEQKIQRKKSPLRKRNSNLQSGESKKPLQLQVQEMSRTTPKRMTPNKNQRSVDNAECEDLATRKSTISTVGATHEPTEKNPIPE